MHPPEHEDMYCYWDFKSAKEARRVQQRLEVPS